MNRPARYQQQCTLQTPSGFDFWRTATSHGWYALKPFSWDPAKRELHRILRISDSKAVHASLCATTGRLQITAQSLQPLSSFETKEIKEQIGSCLRLNEDFRGFHEEARRRPEYRWIAKVGAGRMLRAPTLFEDMVKMICTTNCTWALTTLMTSNLVEALGLHYRPSMQTFPTPEAIAGCTERFLRSAIKTGYRSPYILSFAERVATGKLEIETCRSSPIPTQELLKRDQSVKGVGPYAAANILKLIGRYDYLGLDSWVRAKYYALHRNGRRVKDATIEKHYAGYGRWRGLFFWLEMTRHWHTGKFPA